MGKFAFDAPPGLKCERVKVEEWDPDETFILSELRATEGQEVIEFVQRAKQETNAVPSDIVVYAELLSRCLSTESGAKPSKEWLMQASFVVMKRLGDIAMRLNGLAAGSREQAGKN